MIDWNAQWETHGYCYRDGYVHVDLSEFGKNAVIKLKPGPGFGDLSHPTTWLVLRLMAPHVKGNCVLDVGSGSGILGLTASVLGAKEVYGFDIDPDAVEHARINATLNNLNDVKFGLPGTFVNKEGQLIVLMNMIRTEQSVAWASVQPLKNTHGQAFTSGVLKEELEIYLAQTRSWGWTLQHVIEEGGWLGLHFKF